jgi:hypothetical protein
LVLASDCSCANGVCTVVSPYAVPAGGSLVVPANGRFVFAAGLTLAGTLEVVVNNAATAPVPVTVVGLCNLGGTLVVRTASATPAPGRAVPASFVALTFGSARGVFTGYDVQSTDGCTRLTTVPTITSTCAKID